MRNFYTINVTSQNIINRGGAVSENITPSNNSILQRNIGKYYLSSKNYGGQ